MAEETQAGSKKNYDMQGMIGISDRFAVLNKLITRDLNSATSTSTYKTWFDKYTKEDIQRFLMNPAKHEKDLREAVIYIYGASSHFRRLIQYFVGLSDFAYYLSPYRIDPRKANPKTINSNYRKCMNLMSIMNVKSQFPQILTVCLREDVYYGTIWQTADNITFQRLPSDYCTIASIEGNVPNVTFDFSYFDKHPDMLDFYPEEFRRKYDVYKSNRTQRWIELDSPTSFAVKCNRDILDYAIPPFAGILRELYDLEEYKQLKMAKLGLENYAMIAMTIPLEDGEWGLDYDKAVDFWRNLDAVLPEEVGSILTPMPIEKISFEKSNTGDTDTISDAEQHLFTAAGVSSLLFNNEKASANALLLSIKADQAITYGIVKGIEDVVNRFMQSQNYGKYFRVEFLNCSTYNQKELGDAYLKAASYGLPTISMYAASQGLSQSELDNMSFLEGTVLELQDLFKPIQSSSQMSSSDLDSEAATDEGGAPTKDIGDITDSGEQSSEDKDDWG